MCPGRCCSPQLFGCKTLCVCVSRATPKKEKPQQLRVLQWTAIRKYVTWSSLSVVLAFALCNCVCVCFHGHAADGAAAEAGAEAD